MYLFNPIWADQTSWVSPDENPNVEFSDEVMNVPHRLCVMPFNESLYQFTKSPNAHHQIYYQDLVSKFSVSSVSLAPFEYEQSKHWICSIAMGESFDADSASNQLKFLLKGNDMFAVEEWHQHDMIASNVASLEERGLLAFISLAKLKDLISKDNS